MVNRRVGKRPRFNQKKKLKISSRLLAGANRPAETNENEEAPASPPTRVNKKSSKKSSANSVKENKTLSLPKRKSQTLKRQAAERMVLKEHIRELKARRLRTRKGDDAKTERREIGKFIRQLEAEQKKKHEAELKTLDFEIKNGRKAAALAGLEVKKEEVSEEQLKEMFAHFM